MKFLNLTINNFMPIGHAELGLDGKGLVLLQGVNHDDSSAISNGAGKSTIPDALCWALYGSTARGETGDAIVHNKAKKDCSVAVTMQDGAATYKVTRYRKHSKMKNLVVLEAIDPATGSSTALTRGTNDETDAEIIRIIGCSIEVFTAAIYCGQEEMPDIPALTDKALKLLVEQGAGIERVERAYVVALAKKVEADRAFELAVNKANHLNQARANAQGQIVQLTTDAEKWAEGHLSRIREVEAALAERLVAFRAKAVVVKGYDRSGITGRIAAAQVGLASFNESQASLQVARRTLSTVNAQLSRVESGARFAAEQVKDVKADIASSVDDVGKPCKACSKPHTEADRDIRLAHLTALLAKKVGSFKEDMAALEAVRVEAAAAKAEVARLEAAPAPAALMAELTTLQAELAKIDRETQELRDIVTTQRDQEAGLTGLKAQPNPITAILERTQLLVADLDAQITEAKKVCDSLAEASQTAQDCVKVFGPAGVRAHILDTVTPFLNERTAHYLTVLSDGNLQAVWTTLTRNKGGDLKEKFSIEVSNSKGGATYKLQSGGQKQKVRLATILALQDLVASRASKPIDLWIGDEVDDAVDGAGLERLMAILEERARERGTVVVVSHNELRDWIDDVTTVTLQGGYAKVEGSLCL